MEDGERQGPASSWGAGQEPGATSGLGSEVEWEDGAWDRAYTAPQREPPTSLEGTAQPRVAVPLVVTDGPVAASGGCFGAVTPDTELVSTAFTVPGAELEGRRHNSR